MSRLADVNRLEGLRLRDESRFRIQREVSINIPIKHQEEIEGVHMGGDMNPLRLATLDASPFCFAKRGGNVVARRNTLLGCRVS